MLQKNSVRELVAAFADEDISYVSRRLVFVNEKNSDIAKSENTYWSNDLNLRKIESELQTITARNGALYTCLNKEIL